VKRRVCRTCHHPSALYFARIVTITCSKEPFSSGWQLAPLVPQGSMTLLFWSLGQSSLHNSQAGSLPRSECQKREMSSPSGILPVSLSTLLPADRSFLHPPSMFLFPSHHNSTDRPAPREPKSRLLLS
jgi:hypothetical protein